MPRKPKPKVELPAWVEGGDIADRSGKYTEAVRRKFRQTPETRTPPGNSTLRRFR